MKLASEKFRNKKFKVKEVRATYLEQGLMSPFLVIAREMGIDLKRGGTKFLSFEQMVEIEKRLGSVVNAGF